MAARSFGGLDWLSNSSFQNPSLTPSDVLTTLWMLVLYLISKFSFSAMPVQTCSNPLVRLYTTAGGLGISSAASTKYKIAEGST